MRLPCLLLISLYSQSRFIKGETTTLTTGEYNTILPTKPLPTTTTTTTTTTTSIEVERAISLLRSAGIDFEDVCGYYHHHQSLQSGTTDNDPNDKTKKRYGSVRTTQQVVHRTTTTTRMETEEEEEDTTKLEEEEFQNTFGILGGGEEDGSDDIDSDTTDIIQPPVHIFGIAIPAEIWFTITNGLMALLCVTVAAMAAGLTMGLLSMEELDLHIKERASDDPMERMYARNLMPIISNRHRLLVTLLLLNAMANEALPLFLDKVVPGYLAIILSVTLVLFFGEIIPSAIFSGPNQLAISSHLAPLVRFCLFVLAPLAVPIAKILDCLLHEGGGGGGGGGNGANGDGAGNGGNGGHVGGALQKYNRAELSALVRIQYEQRMADKIHRKKERMSVGTVSGSGNHDISFRSSMHQSLRTAASGDQSMRFMSSRFVRELDTVNIVEGALNMDNVTVLDIMTPLSRVFAVPHDLVLNEANVLEIYRMGHSRIPVYYRNDDGDGDNVNDGKGGLMSSSNGSGKNAICGVFMSKQLIVHNHNEERCLSTMPLTTPICVGKKINLLELLNILQEGIQMAIVCLRPEKGTTALKNGEPIPDEAGVAGIVTLEDCIEELIQEEIYDEFDGREQQANKRASWAFKKWREFVRKRKAQRGGIYEEEHDDEFDDDFDYHCDENSDLLSYDSSKRETLKYVRQSSLLSYDESTKQPPVSSENIKHEIV